ncbi:type I-C CRISPR-associated protein Cas8c/Csd1 [Zavarzinia compransoris]|uniref:Type I-C CRISPR-associated protein Cas8c/Csd1 n=1 Tax=Zavarzinia compransoris TaxID=1264899 RepID=A0A317DUB6_9PROT|nr:type I-C CRISPR-associated protein Cas8c/Csd1 [Zavarzinia compransoris]PWR18277.1 type I-C CRISPR-associated protein Cas8c/Csd1 [Zavarzinia compransoris]TDP43666.1 CRISPR-associated Csd1 family protein [Zavarzinia compransoris]
MTILQALDRYYHRLDDVVAPGWSREKFGWCIILDRQGEPVLDQDLRDLSGKNPKPKLYVVPAAVKRTVGVAPNFLWDKSAYVLGRTAGENKRTAQEHAAFVAFHMARLRGQNDEGLVALRLFLEKWTPARFDAAPFRPEMLDANIMFRLEGDTVYLHERPAARALVEAKPEDGKKENVFCLITGEPSAIARLHPTIKGVEGAQTAGAALVSFNLDAFASLGKEQGENAPTSEMAAFRYGAALNHLLTRDGPNRIRRPIGDATVVFWADAGNAKAAAAADGWFGAALAGDITDADEARKLREELEKVAKGRPLAELRPGIEDGTRFHVLGLSPNAARLSVRFWLSDDLDAFARRLAAHHSDLKLEPAPEGWGAAPSVNRLLVRSIALQGEFKNIPPLLAGEVMRAVLSGGRYPQSLLAATIIRLRAGDDPLSGWHVAVIRAVLTRDHRLRFQKEDVPVSLAREEPNKAYQLGRLFAVLEAAQRMALGKTNTTIRDRYFGAASATPAGVFPLLLRGVQNHLGKLRKDGKGGWIEREIEEILDKLSLDLPRALPLAEQGRFAVGYYHQRKERFKGRPEEAASSEAAEKGDDE